MLVLDMVNEPNSLMDEPRRERGSEVQCRLWRVRAAGVKCVGVLEASMSCGTPALLGALQLEDRLTPYILAESLTQVIRSHSSGFRLTTEKARSEPIEGRFVGDLVEQ